MAAPSAAMDGAAIDLASVERARTRIADQLPKTPTRRSHTLSEMLGVELWLKFENLQFTASFKERGALNKLSSLSDEERARGVVAASAGNHAQAVAYHARRLGIRATIVMPVTTPFIKVSHTELLGAEIEQVGKTVDEAGERARELVRERGSVLIHPFDDPDVIAGQGTLGLELLEDVAELDAIVVPVGGGGLISGIATVVRALAPSVRVVGVQTEQFCVMTQHFRAARALRAVHVGAPLPERSAATPSLGPWGADTLADGIAVKAPGRLTRALIEERVDQMLLVNEEQLERACNDLLEIEKSVVEGAGAASLAAVRQHQAEFAGQRVACVLSGGNLDPRVMADTIMRGLARSGRLARLRVDVRDLPGSLAEITRIIADAGANVVDVRHERVFLASPRARTRLSVEIATRHRDHVERVAQALRTAGHEVEIADVGRVQ